MRAHDYLVSQYGSDTLCPELICILYYSTKSRIVWPLVIFQNSDAGLHIVLWLPKISISNSVHLTITAALHLCYKALTFIKHTGSNVILFSFRDRLHDGVIRDVERQQRRKTENLYLLQQQIELTKQLRKSEDEQLQKSESVG
jgi:hypothetical protein